ncbi:MAG: ROK family protein [Dorea sp.]|nr:ROK family protein [Dorea sp.]
MRYFLILDIGGTKTTTVLFNEYGEPVTDFLVAPSKTYSGKDAVFQNTVELAYKTLFASKVDMKDIVAIGVAAPGPLDYKTGYIIDVPMMGWKDFPLGDKLKNEFGVPVFVENDGNLGALAEATIGVAKGKNVVLYQTISTGCGGGIAINGEIFHGRNGFAGEFGHVTINYGGPRCGCGGSGCFELYASGTAVTGRMIRDIKSGIKSKAFEYIDYDPKRVNGKLLTMAAEENDAYAISILHQEGYYIGVGLSNLINLFDPDAIVLAGGMVKAHKHFYAPMMNEVRRHACFEVSEERILISELNDQVVAYGAYVMAKKAIDGCL